MNYLDLFSGIGGFALAIQRAGIEIDKHYYSEVDKYAQWIYRKQFPGAIRLGDITKIGNEHGKIDLFTGGFPCQAFSIAGKRGGFEDTRGTLFFDIERLARFYKPSYMVLENVKGLYSHDGGNTIRIILDKLRGLDYAVQLLLLNTVDFGIPQNRERLFFICTLAGKRKPEISHIREAKRENSFSSNAIDANYWKGIDNHGQRTCIEVGTKRGESKDGQRIYSDQGAYSCLKAVGEMNAIQTRAVSSPEIEVKNQNGRRIKDNEDPMFTLTSRDRHGICYVENQRAEIRKMSVSPSLQACSSGRVGQGVPVIKDTIIRRLTPTECERLQDYPDDWTKYGAADNSIKIEISDSQRYKTCGNSITVKPAEEICKAIKAVLC